MWLDSRIISVIKVFLYDLFCIFLILAWHHELQILLLKPLKNRFIPYFLALRLALVIFRALL